MLDINAIIEICESVSLIKGKGGFDYIKIKNKASSCLVSIYGAQVLSYIPQGEAVADDMLFLSEQAYYEKGKSIKGGIPICWPAFGSYGLDQGLPFHGFVRNKEWSLSSVKELDESTCQLVFKITQNDSTLATWPYSFELELILTVSSVLTLELRSKNTGQKTMNITQAFHSYLSVADISKISIEGLTGCEYLDMAKSNKGEQEKTQQGNITIENEVDRVYRQVPSSITLKQAAEKTVVLNSKGSKTAIIWNPGPELCQQSQDLADNDYQRFVCIETANAADDAIQLAPQESYSMVLELSRV